MRRILPLLAVLLLLVAIPTAASAKKPVTTARGGPAVKFVNPSANSIACCLEGEYVVGGGFELVTLDPTVLDTFVVTRSQPITLETYGSEDYYSEAFCGGRDGWDVLATEDPPSPDRLLGTWDHVQATVVCANFDK